MHMLTTTFALYAYLHIFLQLKMEYELIKHMHDQSEFGWNNSINTPLVSNDV